MRRDTVFEELGLRRTIQSRLRKEGLTTRCRGSGCDCNGHGSGNGYIFIRYRMLS